MELLKRKIKIAVRDLVDHGLRSGDLVLEFMASGRSVDAIRAHQKIQRSRPAHYAAEVAVSHPVETDHFILIIGGRIDGVYEASDPPCIEEIKTTARNLDYFEKNENSMHWGQLKCYAYIYAKEHGLAEINGQLTYYQIDSGEIRQFQRQFDIATLEAFFQNLIGRYLQWADTVVRWAHLRDESIRDLKFPFGTYRPGQREMAVAVYRSIKGGGQLLVQAATGIGKTMAVIFPAVKAIAEGLHPKIFYLTARTTGRTVAEKALDTLRNNGLRLKYLTLTAKDKVCFNMDSACNPEECEYARGHFDRVNDARQDIFQHDAFTREVIEQTAEAFRVCPFEFSLDLSLWADCIICDYNYAFDPKVFLRRFFQEERENYTFLIDEAHNLADRSREMFSAEIFKQQFLDVRRAVKNELPQIYRQLGKINTWLLKARKKSGPSEPSRSQKTPPEDLYPLLKRFLRTTEHWLTQNIKTKFREALLELYFTAAGFMRVADRYDQSYATCFDRIDKDLKVKLFCIDPSDQLKEALMRCKAAVFFSATMTPMGYFKQVLGCEASAVEMMLPSPFPNENLGIFVSDRVSTLYRHRENTILKVLQAINTLVTQKTGNYLLFFPSYEYMMMVYEPFRSKNSETKTILQTPAMTELQKEAFLARFAQDSPQTLIGFAVMGGIFGEGIDLVGERLSGAVIVGVGLPGISVENELIRQYFAENLDAGFEFAYQYPGINRVLQAAGRVIRSEHDRGVVLLIDQRYGTYRYKSLLPKSWHPIRVQDCQQFVQDLQNFWNQAASG